MSVQISLVVALALFGIADAGESAKDLRQQIREAVAAGDTIDFGKAEHRFGIRFVSPPEHDSRSDVAVPLIYYVGEKLTFHLDWRTEEQESLKACRAKVAR